MVMYLQSVNTQNNIRFSQNLNFASFSLDILRKYIPIKKIVF